MATEPTHDQNVAGMLFILVWIGALTLPDILRWTQKINSERAAKSGRGRDL